MEGKAQADTKGLQAHQPLGSMWQATDWVTGAVGLQSMHGTEPVPGYHPQSPGDRGSAAGAWAYPGLLWLDLPTLISAFPCPRTRAALSLQAPSSEKQSNLPKVAQLVRDRAQARLSNGSASTLSSQSVVLNWA